MRRNLNKTGIGIVCLVWIAMLLFGCAPRSTEPALLPAEEPTPSPTEVPLYRIDYGEKRGAFIDAVDRCAAGETVRLKTYIVYDASPIVTADGERLCPLLTEDGMYLAYTFVMPDHDVVVDYRIEGSDMMALPRHITYEDDWVIDPVTEAYPGETVTLKIGLVFDKITYVYADGETVQQVDGPDEDYLYFAFTMPDHDVTVTVESKNISVE